MDGVLFNLKDINSLITVLNDQQFPFSGSLYPSWRRPLLFYGMDDGPPDTWDRMAAWLQQLHQHIGDPPRAILMISAHWETHDFRVTSNEQPSLIYDYYGFPEHTYQLQYNAPGSPELAAQVCRLLSNANFPCTQDEERGFDHGMFIPLKLIYPDADIPVVCLSLHQNLDPALHLQVGQTLAVLRDQGVLILGSGMSYHNMQGFNSSESRGASDQFDGWLTEVCEQEASARNAKLIEWG